MIRRAGPAPTPHPPLMADVAWRTIPLPNNLRSSHVYRRRSSIVAPFTERVAMVKGSLDKNASTATSYAWLVFRRASRQARGSSGSRHVARRLSAIAIIRGGALRTRRPLPDGNHQPAVPSGGPVCRSRFAGAWIGFPTSLFPRLRCGEHPSRRPCNRYNFT